MEVPQVSSNNFHNITRSKLFFYMFEVISMTVKFRYEKKRPTSFIFRSRDNFGNVNICFQEAPGTLALMDIMC